MRGIAALLPAKYKFKQMFPMTRSWGSVASLTPKKQESNEMEEGRIILNERTDTLVALSRPPPLPPVLGPLVALSLLEMWSDEDE